MQNPLKRENDEKEPRIGQQEPQILLPPDRGAAYPLRADAVKGGLGAQPQPLHRRANLRRDVPRGQGRPHEATLPRPAERVYRPDFARGEQLQSGRQGDQHLPFAQHAAPPDRHAGGLYARVESPLRAGVGADRTITRGMAERVIGQGEGLPFAAK